MVELTGEQEAERGRKAARELLAQNPSTKVILRNWSCACVDGDMGDDPYFARGYKEILRPAWKTACAGRTTKEIELLSMPEPRRRWLPMQVVKRLLHG
jgi:hypothetical protein